MIPLPPGFSVKKEPCVGVSYMYDGLVVIQWVKDENLSRRGCWQWYKKHVLEEWKTDAVHKKRR